MDDEQYNSDEQQHHPDGLDALREELEPRLEKRGRRAKRLVALVLVVIAAALAFYIWRVDRNVNELERLREDKQQADTTADKAIEGVDANCQRIQQLGGTCPVKPEDVKRPDPPPPPRPSDEQVRAAVDEFFRKNPPEPGRPPTPAEIAVAVIAYLRDNPPARGEPGAPPTADQIANAVAAYIAANPLPPGPKGDKGEDGKDGRPPTAEELAQAVKDYVAANPLPVCPSGTNPEAHSVVTATGPVDAIICVREAAPPPQEGAP